VIADGGLVLVGAVGIGLGDAQALSSHSPIRRIAEHVGERRSTLARTRRDVVADHRIGHRRQPAVHVLRMGGINRVLIVGVRAERTAADGNRQQAVEPVVGMSEHRADGVGLGCQAMVRIVGVSYRPVLGIRRAQQIASHGRGCADDLVVAECPRLRRVPRGMLTWMRWLRAS